MADSGRTKECLCIPIFRSVKRLCLPFHCRLFLKFKSLCAYILDSSLCKDFNTLSSTIWLIFIGYWVCTVIYYTRSERNIIPRRNECVYRSSNAMACLLYAQTFLLFFHQIEKLINSTSYFIVFDAVKRSFSRQFRALLFGPVSCFWLRRASCPLQLIFFLFKWNIFIFILIWHLHIYWN